MQPLMLWELLPLRTTAELGDYAEKVPLPIVIGDLRGASFPLVRLTGEVYFAADHPMDIDAVFVDRAAVADWQAELATDAVAGRTWTVVRFGSPVPVSSQVAATGIGLPDARTGAIADNPADMLDRVSALADRPDVWSDLRAECSRLGITVATRLAQAQSVRAAIDAVTQSIGAIWTPGMARLYPSSDAPSPIIDLYRHEVADLRFAASVADTADILRLSYDVSDAREKPQQFIELRASPMLYGGVSVEHTAALLRTPQAAEAVGRNRLSRLAGERYDVSFTTTRRSLRPGMWVRPVAHPQRLYGEDPVVMVLGIQQQGASLEISGEWLRTTPSIEVIGHSVALPDSVAAALSVAYDQGVATLTLTRETDGAPIGGALVALDGGIPQTTDQQGKARFQTTRGVHRVAASAPGFAPFEIDIEI